MKHRRLAPMFQARARHDPHRGGRATNGVGCGGGRACQARLPARCRIDREDHPCADAGGGVRHGLEPGVRASLTEIGRDPDAPWTSDEFTHIARIQCWYEDTLARSAREVLFCDTDAFTTALFHQVYLGEPTHAFDDLLERRYDLYFVCGIEVPWKHDGVREFEEQRHWMHERYLERAAESGSPWVLLEGPQAARLQESSSAVDQLLAGGLEQ